MDLDLVFLGTAGSVPTPRRGLASALIRRGGERLLLDCGEGTQRQLMRSTGLSDIDAVFITHLHADHVLGLPGMLKTFGLRERTQPLTIVGPRGLAAFWKVMRSVVGRLPYEVDLTESDGGVLFRSDGYVVEGIPTDHTTTSLGFALREDARPGTFDVARANELGVPSGPQFGALQRGEAVQLPDGTVVDPGDVVGPPRRGRTVVYSGDTRASAPVRDAAGDCTLLVHEATFCLDEQERAISTGHSTAHDAALTATAANAAMLVLTHLSTRYRARDVEDEARAVFPTAVCARDFDIVELPFPERGSPVLRRNAARSTGRSAVNNEPALLTGD